VAEIQAATEQTPAVARVLPLIDAALAKLKLNEPLSLGGSEIFAAVDPRMSFLEEAAQFSQPGATGNGPPSVAYSSMLAQRTKCATILQQWGELCDADGGVPGSEATVRSAFCSSCMTASKPHCLLVAMLHIMMHQSVIKFTVTSNRLPTPNRCIGH
jgi:hypothetical protein